MKFLKENPALAVGIGLPIIVVIFFALATIVPTWLVPPPQYDAVFSINAPNYSAQTPSNGETKYAVADGHVKAYRRFDPKNNCCPNNLQLYYYEAKTGRVREIFIAPAAKPADADGEWKEFSVPEVANLKLDGNSTSPDGYEFHDRSGYYSGEMWPFFGGSSTRERVMIGKQGREISIPLPDHHQYYSDSHFLGWVVGK